MDYIILNNDGSLNKQSLDRYINQGSHGVDKIFIGWANGLATDFLQAVFTLPNQMTNTVLGEFEENYNYDGEHTINGWVITLTDAQTTYNGLLMVSARIIRNGIVQVAYPFSLCINETGVRPETDSGVTLAQIDSYLLNLQNLVTGAVQANTDSALSNTSENPVQNKVVKAAIDDAIAGVYKVQGSANVSTLNGLTKSAELNGNVYNVLDAGTLTNSTDTTSVQIGDNVVFVWNEGTWYWDRLAGVVDTSGLAVKSGNNDFTGVNNFKGEVDFTYSSSNTSYKLSVDSNDYLHFKYGTTTLFSLQNTSGLYVRNSILPNANNTYSLGSSSYAWKDLYLSGKLYFNSNYIYESSNILTFYLNGADRFELTQNTFRPVTSGNLHLGSSSKKIGDIYFSGTTYVTYGGKINFATSNTNVNWDITTDAYENIVFARNSAALYYFGSSEIAPKSNSVRNLGTSGLRWNYVYANYISDGTNSVAVGNITAKIDTTDTYDVGAFDANGEITVDISTLEQDIEELGWGQELHGIYMLTYSYAQTIMYLDKTQIDTAALSNLPIRATMPVVYNALLGSSVPGNIRVQKVGTNYVFRVSDGSQHAASGLHLFMVKTDLVQ